MHGYNKKNNNNNACLTFCPTKCTCSFNYKYKRKENTHTVPVGKMLFITINYSHIHNQVSPPRSHNH